MTAADLARIYHVTPATITRWARQDEWPHRGHPRRYNPADADRSWRRRHQRPSGVAALAARLDITHNKQRKLT